MDDYKCYTDDFEVRSSIKNKMKQVLVRGYATFKGLDTYNTELSEKAMKKVADQLKQKHIKIGFQHQKHLKDRITQRLSDIKTSLESDGKNTDLINEALSLNNDIRLPLGKPRQVEFDKDGVFVEVEINPYLETLDPEYYKAAVGMIEDKFIDGFSIEFTKDYKSYDTYDAQGARKTIIDDLTISGLELVSGASNSGARITDVLVRMAGIHDEEKKMEENKEVITKEQYDKVTAELNELKEKLEAVLSEKTKAEEEKTQAVADTEKIKQDAATESKTIKEELDEVKELLKANLEKGQLSVAKSIVAQEDKYGNTAPPKEENVEELRKKLDETPMAELVQKIYSDQ